jgi:hypothetical protein
MVSFGLDREGLWDLDMAGESAFPFVIVEDFP